jgi:hypothetical protein
MAQQQGVQRGVAGSDLSGKFEVPTQGHYMVLGRSTKDGLDGRKPSKTTTGLCVGKGGG